MYLSELNLWNFRKYGTNGDGFEKAKPGLSVQFKAGLNVLIGENDSGKTAIVDAIRYVLGTQSGDWIRVQESDFHCEGAKRARDLKVECVFRGLCDTDAAHFLEWLGTEETEGAKVFVLKVRLTARIKENNRVVSWIRAGQDPVGIAMEGEARDFLRVTYLKPLRDADNELTPGRRSRFAQILKAHALFQTKEGKKHELEDIFEEASRKIVDYFKPNTSGAGAGRIMGELKGYLDAFFSQDEPRDVSVNISGGDLSDILQRLDPLLDPNLPGLGSANLLFMAAELLLLQSEENAGLRLALIEELESHLHPQAQLRLIRFLEEKSTKGQFILTTHSTTLGSSVPLESLVISKRDKAFPMGRTHTKLRSKDYGYLYRFLDATKANLFFARGVLIVEGDAENLLIPTIARIVDRPLHRYGVSIVNVGSTAFSHFAQIFHRKDGGLMGVKVAIVTDMDVKPQEALGFGGMVVTPEEIACEKEKRRDSLKPLENEEVKVFVSPNWTLEYEIALSKFAEEFYRALLWAEKIANSQTGLPLDGKESAVANKAEAALRSWKQEWQADSRCREKIAFEIYQKTMLEKRISKAVTAQVFAEYLERIEAPKGLEVVKSKLRNSSDLKYLLDAICHVTQPLEAPDGS